MMRITSVDIIQCEGAPPQKINVWNPTVVRINTDEGISGFGEIGLAYGNNQEAAFGILQDFALMIAGMDPMNIEKIWDKIYKENFWSCGGGALNYGGISAIDIALWDIKGKKLGVPVYQLLGGKTNERLRAYASQIQFDWGKESVPMITYEDYFSATRKAMKDGFDAVKVDPVGYDLEGVWTGLHSNQGLLKYRQIEIAKERVAAIREAGGADLDIIIELHAMTDTNTAIQLAKELEQYRVYYYEEPTAPEMPRLFNEMADKINIPLASGERIYGRKSYAQFFEGNGTKRALSIIQPDLGTCGGLSEGKKICDMAHAYDIAVQLHICGGPVATAAALHLETVIPNFLIHEHHAVALLEPNIRLCKYDYQPVAGYFTVPELPGIGQELSEETIANSRVVTIA